jgi:hypothetical protein
MAQIVEAGRFGIEEALQAVCSWYAVGVLPATHPLVLATFGQCVAPPAPERHEPPKRSSDAPAVTTICSGHGNHTVCDPTVPSLAAVCAAGEIVSASTCADLGMRCKPASASDPTATLDLDGALVCE